MELKDYNDTIGRIRDNIGSELSAANSEDFLGITGAFSELHQNYEDLKAENEKLKNDKEELLKTNGKLFQKIGFDNNVTFSENKNDSKEEKEEIIKLEELINEKGEII